MGICHTVVLDVYSQFHYLYSTETILDFRSETLMLNCFSFCKIIRFINLNFHHSSESYTKLSCFSKINFVWKWKWFQSFQRIIDYANGDLLIVIHFYFIMNLKEAFQSLNSIVTSLFKMLFCHFWSSWFKKWSYFVLSSISNWNCFKESSWEMNMMEK